MAGYIGSKAVFLSTTTASVGGDSTVGGDLTVDTDTLYVDSTNNRVGIGNTSPTQALDVTGDIITSGGVYLGGAGSANKLDDYEEGTWTPSFASDGSVSATYTTQVGRYVKTGKLVYAAFDLEGNITAFSGSVAGVSTLPFIPGGTLYYGGGPVFRSTTAVLLAGGQTLRGYAEVNGRINLQSMELDSGENAFVGLRTGTPRRLNGYVVYTTA